MKHLAYLLSVLLFGCSSASSAPLDQADPPADPSADDEEGDAYEAYDPEGKADGVSLPKGPVKFSQACTPGEKITIAAVGDLLLHKPLQTQAIASSTRFRSLWRGVDALLQKADITYANLEGPTAAGVNSSGKAVADPGFVFDDVVYTSYPMFNYHPSLIDDLLASGIDVVSTANNHSVDRRSLGVDRTIEALDAAGLPHSGTRASSDTQGPWHTFTDEGKFHIAWLACTYATNGIPDSKHQVLHCINDADAIESMVKELSTTTGVDAVIVTPHWGVEYSANPEASDVKLGHRWLEAGATALIGSHPHVTQPWEKYVTKDGRETFVLYSLGNFVSGQSHLARRSTLMLWLGLTRGADGKVWINGVRYVPMCMTTVDGERGVFPVDTTPGLGDSRALTVKMFGTWNLSTPDTASVTNPECDPNWTPADK